MCNLGRQSNVNGERDEMWSDIIYQGQKLFEPHLDIDKISVSDFGKGGALLTDLPLLQTWEYKKRNIL